MLSLSCRGQKQVVMQSYALRQDRRLVLRVEENFLFQWFLNVNSFQDKLCITLSESGPVFLNALQEHTYQIESQISQKNKLFANYNICL